MSPQTMDSSIKKDPPIPQVLEEELHNEIITEASQSSDLAEVLRQSLQRGLGFVAVDKGGIYLLYVRSGLLKVAAHAGLSAEFVKQIDCLKLGEVFSGRVA